MRMNPNNLITKVHKTGKGRIENKGKPRKSINEINRLAQDRKAWKNG